VLVPFAQRLHAQSQAQEGKAAKACASFLRQLPAMARECQPQHSTTNRSTFRKKLLSLGSIKIPHQNTIV